MLKIFLLLFITSIALINANLEDAVNGFFEQRCSKGGNPNAYSELLSASIRVKICVENNVPSSVNEAETFKAICTESYDNIYKCVEDLLEKFEPCLEPEEKYLPDFVLGSFNNTLDEQCKDSGKFFLEQRANLKHANCSVASGTITPMILETCAPKLKLIEALKKTDFVLRQDELCSDIETMKNCFLDVFEERCENDTYTQYIETFFSPVLDWCTEQRTNNKLGEN
ncbi:hypothetical protein ILUMI_11426 [Ignelater luminosus]|uniref:DUF19 domain-containing protein n=1 Tax=Ignelater luminosus TaxID=2038154 RepID=A0A8K0D0A5_IGNLU|nr:hypothetical protein ILUMI_11426 [Ignelater luminosus]